MIFITNNVVKSTLVLKFFAHFTIYVGLWVGQDYMLWDLGKYSS